MHRLIEETATKDRVQTEEINSTLKALRTSKGTEINTTKDKMITNTKPKDQMCLS